MDHLNMCIYISIKNTKNVKIYIFKNRGMKITFRNYLISMKNKLSTKKI